MSMVASGEKHACALLFEKNPTSLTLKQDTALQGLRSLLGRRLIYGRRVCDFHLWKISLLSILFAGQRATVPWDVYCELGKK